MTLIVDCLEQITTKLRRISGTRLPTDGLILTGIQMLQDEGYYLGDIQMFLIASRPDEAFFMCTKYSPNCPGTVTLGGSQQAASNRSGRTGSRTISSSRSSSSRSSSSRKNGSGGSSLSAKGSSNGSGSEMKEEYQGSLRNELLAERENYTNVDGAFSRSAIAASAGRVAITASVLGESAEIGSTISRPALSLDQPILAGPANHRRKNETSNLAAFKVDETAAIKPKRTSGNGADEIYDYLDYGNEDYFEVKDDLGAANDTRGNKKKGNFVKSILRMVKIN